mmetsp:Transcript_60771/g.177573  ORF Transcript_60771/g.177573 Transcript_60771/m.177573 type:complete len:226 (-) Transcript_60771:986-1663(-)
MCVLARDYGEARHAGGDVGDKPRGDEEAQEQGAYSKTPLHGGLGIHLHRARKVGEGPVQRHYVLFEVLVLRQAEHRHPAGLAPAAEAQPDGGQGVRDADDGADAVDDAEQQRHLLRHGLLNSHSNHLLQAEEPHQPQHPQKTDERGCLGCPIQHELHPVCRDEDHVWKEPPDDVVLCYPLQAQLQSAVWKLNACEEGCDNVAGPENSREPAQTDEEVGLGDLQEL